MNNILLSLAAIVACTIAAPAIQSCTMIPDLFAYCNKSVNDTELDDGLLALYIKSDNMIDLLEAVCTKAVSVYSNVVNAYQQSMTHVLIPKISGMRKQL